MAFSKGSDNSLVVARPKYWGIGYFNVIAVNPSKDQLVAMGINAENEPVYTGTFTDENTKAETPYFAAEFYLKPTQKHHEGVEKIFRVRYTVQRAAFIGSQSGKYQVIDEFGRTAWATESVIQQREIPIYSSGPASITNNYRLSFRGEDKLTEFIIKLLNIPAPTEKVNGTFVMKADTSECLARFETLDRLFAGDFSELKSIISMYPNGIVKAAVGIRTTNEGNQYEFVFPDVVSPYQSNDTIKKRIDNAKAAGSLSTVDFFVGDLQEYKVAPSVAPVQQAAPSPFGAPAQSGFGAPSPQPAAQPAQMVASPFAGNSNFAPVDNPPF